MAAKMKELGFDADDTAANIYFVPVAADGTEIASVEDMVKNSGKQVGGLKCVVGTGATQVAKLAPSSCVVQTAPTGFN